MTKFILCFALVLMNTIGLRAQITLSTQAEVDAWDQSITVLTEYVIINGSDITNIDALSNLNSISGKLTISYNNNLQNIDGLSSLTSLEGNLTISSCSLINNVDGLSNLNSVTGQLDIINNDNLQNVDGLSSLTSLEGNLNISSCSLIDDVDGLLNLNSVSGILYIRYNDNLQNVDGLSNLNSISGQLYISYNENLQNVDGLLNLNSISGQLYISYNENLQNIDGLSNLNSISGILHIRYNDNLQNIDGLSNLNSVTGETALLIISYNENLQNVDGLSNLNSVTGAAARLLISYNDNLQNVDGLSNLNSISGQLNIGNNDNLQNIDGLSNLNSITGQLDIRSNDNMQNVDGLSGLTSLEGTLTIFSCSLITNIDGLSNLNSVTGQLNIRSNDNLQNIDGLSNLNSVSGHLDIRSNDNMQNIDGLSNLNSVTGATTRLIISYNDNLQNIDGLSGLTSLEGNLTISSCSLINNVDGLSNLNSVTGQLYIGNNDNLQNVNGLSGISTVNGSINISNNQDLLDCCILKNLSNYQSVLYLINNGDGGSCQSLLSLEEADCGLTLAYETHNPCLGLNNGEIKLYPSNYDTIPFNYTITDMNQQLVASGTSFDDVICIEGLAEGTYRAYVTQPNGDEFTLNNIVLDPLASPSLDIVNVSTTSSFNGLPTGSIALDYSGGSPPYTISLSGPINDQINSGSTSTQFDNLSAGDYTVIVADSEGTTRSLELKIVDETLPAEECSDPMDIIVLNLVSSAISADEYAQSKPYFQSFFESLNLGTGPDDSQVAVAEWAGKNDQDLKIPLTGDLSQLSLYQEHNRSYTGGTDPLFALKYGYEYLLANGTSNAQKVIIFTYDGCPGFSASAYAEELKELGIIIADIGIDYVSNSSSYQNILRKAASRDNLAYFAQNFDSLDPLELYVELSFANCSGTTSNIYFDRDGSITIDNVSADNCPYPDLVEITFTIAALEQLSIPIGTPVSFYNNNPNQYGASLISTFLVPCPIPAGESESFTISLPIETATHLFAVLNDNGQTSPAFSLPVTDIQESLYNNNIDDKRICVDGFATLQALKSSVSLYPICKDIVQYTIDVCNISQINAIGVMIQDESPVGFDLVETIVNTNNCSINNSGSYDIPAGCCVSLTLAYNVAYAAHGYYGDQDVFLSGPSGQTYLDFDGATTSAEDILLDSTEDCGTPVVTFQKEVNYATTCVDHSLTYTFTIDNQSSNPLYGVQFTDVLPAPLEWVYKPYDKQGLSINIDDFLEGQTASFIIDEIDAETTATFVIDVYVGYTDVEVTANNTARISGFPDYINDGIDFLESNTTSTTILGDIEIISIDTIIVNANENIISLNTQITPVATIEWTSSGDGTFSDKSVTDPTYTLGEEDRLDTLIGLFIGVDTYCGQKGKSVYIKRECSLEFDPVNVLEVCDNQKIDATLSWEGGIGPFSIDEISENVDMANSYTIAGLSEGNYTYTLNDAMGCESTIRVDVVTIDSPKVSAAAYPENCNQADGSLVLDISVGTPPYTIEGLQTWSGVTDQLSIPDLTAGDYTFIVTDSKGCSSEEILTVGANSGLETQKSITQPNCGESFGSMILSWTDNSSSYNIEGDINEQNITSPYERRQLDTGNYQITLTDEHGCSDELSFVIEDNPSPTATVNPVCIDSNFYSINITTGAFDIENDLGLSVTKITADSSEILDIPIDQPTIITITNPSNGCQSLFPIDPPDCSCSAVANVGLDKEISCYDEMVLLDASASSQGAEYTYAWYDASGNLLSTQNRYQTDQPGTYTFEITDLLHNCTVLQELTVTDIRNTPMASIIHNNNLLTCDSLSIDLAISAQENVVYTWQHLSSGEEWKDQQILVDKAGEIQLLALDTITGCSSEDVVLIEMDTVVPAIELEDPEMLNCQTNTVQLDANGSDAGNYAWLNESLDTLSKNIPVLSVQEPGTFYFTLVNPLNGCHSSEAVIVSANYDTAQIDLDEEIRLSCSEEQTTISAIVTSNHAYDLSWIKDQLAIAYEAEIPVSQSGTYILEVTDQFSFCTIRDTIEVLPAKEIESLVLRQSDLNCFEDYSGEIEITDVIGGTPGYDYFLNGEQVDQLKIDGLEAGTYTIYIKDTANCVFDTLISLTEPPPILNEINLDDYVVSVGGDVEITIETNIPEEDISDIIWYPGIDCEKCLNYTFENVQEDANYAVTIVDNNGCEETVELRILTKSSRAVYLPNIMNPNTSNDGVFFPQASNSNIIVKEMNIYDRWGSLIFVNKNFPVNDPRYGWDGTFNGKQVEIGVYVYTIILESDSESLLLKGDVTLIR